MRLNAETMSREDFYTYMIYDYNGNEVHFCTVADTEQGYALCTMYTTNKNGSRIPLGSYDENNPYDLEGTVHEYQLHSFVIRNNKTGEIVAKV